MRIVFNYWDKLSFYHYVINWNAATLSVFSEKI